MPFEHDTIFWSILLALFLTLFGSALEFTSVSTAVPIIAADLGGRDFVWVGTAYVLASSVPVIGGIAHLFGLGYAAGAFVGFFALGCTICGAAGNMGTMIAGRAIQGIGGGGALSFILLFLGDFVPPEQHRVFAGLFGLTWSVGAALGPVASSGLASSEQWRWLFFLNIPLCIVSFVLVILLIRIPVPPGTLKEKISRMDLLGSFIAIAATCSTTFALIQGGVNAPWDSPRIISPLIIGVVGLVVYFAYEALWAGYPLVPCFLLFGRFGRYAQTFLLPMTTITAIYYMPIYFQSCTDATGMRSGVLLLGLAIIAPATTSGLWSVYILKHSRWQACGAWFLQLIGMTLMTFIELGTSPGVAVAFCVLFGVGAGLNYAGQVYPFHVPSPISNNPQTLNFSFHLGSFGAVWGITLGGTILQTQLLHRLPHAYFSQFPGGVAVVSSVIPQIRDFPQPLKDEVRQAFIGSLRVVWNVMAGICGLGLVASLPIKGLSPPVETEDVSEVALPGRPERWPESNSRTDV